MHIEVDYETKANTIDKIMPSQVIKYCSISGSVEQREREFIIRLDGEEYSVIETLRIIWELAFLYDGYFYNPKKYIVDEKEKKTTDLYFLTFYKTGKTWRNVASSLAIDKKDFSEEKLLEYYALRNMSRESGKLLKSLINSFYYLHSEAYEKINVNHRLSLLLNICDGFVINTSGPTNNVKSNIKRVLGNNLNIKLVKYGSSLLGIPGSKLYDALTQERHEIDHYIIKEGSVTDYVSNAASKTTDYINWYFTYVLELALRIAFLKQIGYYCSDTRIEYAMNEINDWIILECDLTANCKNPLNKMKQDMKRLGIEMR